MKEFKQTFIEMLPLIIYVGLFYLLLMGTSFKDKFEISLILGYFGVVTKDILQILHELKDQLKNKK